MSGAARAATASGSTARVVAAAVLAAHDARRQIDPLSESDPGFDLAAAYAVTAELRRLRMARGERPVGRKIGFTNRTIWPEYGVYAPIWGDMYHTTVADAVGTAGTIEVGALLEPRIEPEIAFGLARAPEPGMEPAALIGCVDWVAHGVEIVQSLFPGWRFAAADTVAAFGLHGRYLIGPRHPVRSSERGRWVEALAGFEIALARDGALIDRGAARNVLDGPLFALGHLATVLAGDPHNPPLAAGEIVTTGTVTRAFPVRPGEVWTTTVTGAPLPGLTVRIA